MVRHLRHKLEGSTALLAFPIWLAELAQANYVERNDHFEEERQGIRDVMTMECEG